MHFRHRQADRQTDTDIAAQARDVYKMAMVDVDGNCLRWTHSPTCVHVSWLGLGVGGHLALEFAFTI